MAPQILSATSKASPAVIRRCSLLELPLKKASVSSSNQVASLQASLQHTLNAAAVYRGGCICISHCLPDRLGSCHDASRPVLRQHSRQGSLIAPSTAGQHRLCASLHCRHDMQNRLATTYQKTGEIFNTCRWSSGHWPTDKATNSNWRLKSSDSHQNL